MHEHQKSLEKNAPTSKNEHRHRRLHSRFHWVNCVWNMPSHRYRISTIHLMGSYLYYDGRNFTAKPKKSEHTGKKCYSSISMHARAFNGREQCAIDSNQKSVKCICGGFFFLSLWMCVCGCMCRYDVVQKHKEIKIDDDCNMMMVHCIKIQKFLGLQPKWEFLRAFIGTQTNTHTNIHVCGKQTSACANICMNICGWEICMPKDRYIKCAAYVNHFPLASNLWAAWKCQHFACFHGWGPLFEPLLKH